MTRTAVTVELGDRSYPIHIGDGVLCGEALRRHVRGTQVAIVTNQVVEPLWLSTLEQALEGSNAAVDVYVLPDGEAEKNLANYEAILEFLVVRKHNRSTTVIALGGGVVGDMAGFAAATYQRGVDFIQVPTTLLAQVDSSVGGKTAVNLPQGKNLVGAFYQPRAVFADSRFLETLPPRELRAGLAEVIKYGIIRDREFFDWLTENADLLLERDPEALVHAVARSCEVKAEVVSADEREGGIRAILNFGHTFGHAIESLTGYTRFLHGEAVAIGMVMAADVSWRHGLIDRADAQLIRNAVAALGLPDTPPELSPQAMINTMSMDKKVLDGRLRLVVCRGIGDAFLSDEVAASTLAATLKAGAALCER
jgi:3-dehydroquinate synthase